jgi:hypothetical protein
MSSDLVNESNIKGLSRPLLDRCISCKRFTIDSKKSKFKFGCSYLCPMALESLVSLGFVSYYINPTLTQEWESKHESHI